MLFTSLEFVFLFLPVVLAVYYVVPGRLRNAWLLAASLVFYAWGEPRFVVALVVSIAMNWLLALAIGHCGARRSRTRQLLLSAAVVANLSLIGVWKYANFLTSVIRAMFPSWCGVVPQTSFLLPIGISFFTFQAMSYVIDVYRGAPARKNPIDIALYVSMFPQLVAGPIVRWETVAEQISSRRESLTLFSQGVHRFLLGFNKKMLLANLFAVTADNSFQFVPKSICGAWLGAIAYTLQIFFDFSGYSDMAIGLGLMFGFRFDENFRYPYISRSVTEFWRRWHISLGSWFRDYLYFPLGGSRVSSRARLMFNLAIVWFATGVWHGANWTFILWGMFYGVLIIAEKLTGLPKRVEAHPGLAVATGPATMLAVIFGWVLFRSDTIGFAWKYIGAMFGSGTVGLVDDRTVFEFGEIAIVLCAGILGAIPWVPWLAGRLSGVPRLLSLLGAAGRLAQILLFFIGVSYLAMNAHNPFIYFNF